MDRQYFSNLFSNGKLKEMSNVLSKSKGLDYDEVVKLYNDSYQPFMMELLRISCLISTI